MPGVLQGDAPSSVQQTGGRRRPRLASDVRRQGRQGRVSLIQIADFDVSGLASLTCAQGQPWLLQHLPLLPLITSHVIHQKVRHKGNPLS